MALQLFARTLDRFSTVSHSHVSHDGDFVRRRNATPLGLALRGGLQCADF